MKKIFVLVVASFMLFSWKNIAAFPPDGYTFYFENLQPINDSELNSIPDKFIGDYKNSDEHVLKIRKNDITSESLSKFRFPKNQMDSLKTDFNFANGKCISKLYNTVYDYKIVGDSIEFSSKKLIRFLFSQIVKRQNESMDF